MDSVFLLEVLGGSLDLELVKNFAIFDKLWTLFFCLDNWLFDLLVKTLGELL